MIKIFPVAFYSPLAFAANGKPILPTYPPPSLSETIKQRLMVELSLEVAHSRLGLADWKSVKEGDFIVLDHCSYNPVEHKGGVVLTLNQKPVFRGRIKDGGIKITNYPLYEEVSDVMEEKNEEENLYGDLDDDDDEDSEFEDEDDLFAGLEDEKIEKKEPGAEKSISDEKPISLVAEELPVHLTVEVGRFRITAAELMKLAPGNLLDLNVTPEQGVDLVVNGKKVGRGELVRMGDVLGVRILSI